MVNLMLHTGTRSLSRHDLAQLPVPAPLGARHVVRPFIEDVEIVTDLMRSNGLTIKQEAFGITGTNEKPKRFFGLIEVNGGNGEYALMIGLRGSYDQSLPRGLAVGSRVFVCDNLAFSAEITLQTRQTTFIGKRIPEMLARAVDKIPKMAALQASRFEAYRNISISRDMGDLALVALYRKHVLNSQTLAHALQDWGTPQHEEHLVDGRTVWTLHNAVTEALKSRENRANVLPVWDKTQVLTKHLDAISKFTAGEIDA